MPFQHGWCSRTSVSVGVGGTVRKLRVSSDQGLIAHQIGTRCAFSSSRCLAIFAIEVPEIGRMRDAPLMRGINHMSGRVSAKDDGHSCQSAGGAAGRNTMKPDKGGARSSNERALAQIADCLGQDLWPVWTPAAFHPLQIFRPGARAIHRDRRGAGSIT